MSVKTLQILLVDDDKDHVELIRRAFVSNGNKFKVTTTASLTEARKLLKKATPDLMVVDFLLPDGEGLELLPGNEEEQTMPIIILTGQGNEKIATAAIKAGAMDYIVKSIETFAEMPHIVERTMREWNHISERRQAEKKLEKSERKYRNLFEAVEISIWNEDMSAVRTALNQLRLDGVKELRKYLETNEQVAQEMAAMVKVVQVNKATLKLFGAGQSREQLLAQIDKTFGPDAPSIFIDGLCAIWNKEKVFRSEVTLQALDGKTINALISFQIPEDDADFNSIPVSIIDITERKKIEESIHESQIKLTEAQQIGHMGNWEYNLIHNRGIFSDEAYRIFGVSPGFGGSFKSFFQFIHPDDRGVVVKARQKLISTGSCTNIEYRIIRPDGEVRFIQSNGECQSDGSGKLIRLFGSIQDITERKQAEEKIRDSQSKLAEAQQIGHMGNWEFHSISGGGQYSDETARIFGYPDGYKGSFKSFFSLIHPDDQRVVHEARQQAVKTGGFSNVQYRIIRPDGCLRFIQSNGKCEKDRSGKIIRIFGSIQDITERKLAEKSLQESETRFKGIFNSSPDPCWIINENNQFILCNQAAAVMLGYDSIQELQKIHPSKLSPEIQPDGCNSFEKANAMLAIAHEKGVHRFEWEHCRRSGECFPVEVTLAQLIVGGKKRLYCIWRDITERKQAEETLRTLSSAIEQAGESIVITDREGIIEYANPAFSKLTGYSAEEAIGQTPRLLKSGNEEVAFYDDIWDTISRGKVWHGKVIDKKKDGSFYPAMLTISPIFDQSGDSAQYSHFVGIQSDLSRLEDMEQQFHQAQKMEALGTLVGGIAHDFNNMLAGMTGNIYLAKKRVLEQPDVVEKLANVESIAFRAAEMIQQLLTFARKDMVSMKQMPLTPFIKETIKFLHTSIPENIVLHQDICSESLIVTGDGTRLHQALMNLVNNARDAVEGMANPCITIRLESFHADDLFVETHPYFKSGDYAHLSVEDNGMGIPEYQIEHLFEPFFTTKEQGKGTGLGLAMVFGAIKTHYGFVEVESVETEGSSFHVYLPLLEQKEVTAIPSQKQEAAKGSGEIILLVDDQEQVLATGKEVLESLGYQVLTATDGQQAVELFESRAGEIDLVILDVVMPVLGGIRAAQCIRQLEPQAKIIFSTGYDKDDQADMKNEIVLSKPFSIAEMSHLIRQQLGLDSS